MSKRGQQFIEKPGSSRNKEKWNRRSKKKKAKKSKR